METISKKTVRILAGLLEAYGVRHIVVSSGSRCAPLSVAFSRCGSFELHPVIDERSAAFVALGIALALDAPVAMVCTSGTAPLNYAPALAEAFYRRIPLIAITADRPWWWVDQREGQTIRQARALDSVVRRSVDLRPEEDSRNLAAANRMVNEALDCALGPVQGPVHINVQLDAPLTTMAPADKVPLWRKIDFIHAAPAEPAAVPSSEGKVLVVVGDNRFSLSDLSAIGQFSAHPSVMLLAEVQANIPGALPPALFDELFAKGTAPQPDVLISLGGALIDNKLKQWLRTCPARHISVGPDDGLVDTFGHLEATLDMPVATALQALEPTLSICDYKALWPKNPAVNSTTEHKFFNELASAFTQGTIHISNGTSIRTAQRVAWSPGVRIECNRGVSGIEGSTSTAIGSAMVSERPVMLITGDMSAAYDISALSLRGIPSTFRMVVIDNDGGNIFRQIDTTRHLPELEFLFTMPRCLPLRDLAQAYGFDYFTDNIPAFLSSPRPSIFHFRVSLISDGTNRDK